MSKRWDAMSILRIVFAGAVAALCARAAAVPPVIPGDSARGERLFETAQCIRCHAVNGRGGKIGLDLGMTVSRGYTPAQLASTMWNHAPVMWGVMEAGGIPHPKVSARDAADLFAFFYSAQFFDKPGDAVQGKATFQAKRCASCHGIDRSRAEGAPPVVKWESLADPVVLARQMWNHSHLMRQAFARRKMQWQALKSEELNDILAYLRSLPEAAHLISRFSNTSDEGGRQVFEAKGCANCHQGTLALEHRLKDMTLTDIAVDMWNHAPRMAQTPPMLSDEEMRRLLSYLWMRQFVYPGGNIERGKKVFAERQCATCHAGGTHGAPQLPGQARAYSEVSIISALWRHGPQMLNRMKQAGIDWPMFEDASEVADLIAYLNSVQ